MEGSIMDGLVGSGGEDRGPRILVYLLLDVSGSMSGAPIQAVNEGVELLIRELKKVPEAIQMAQLSVITFGSNAQVVVPLTPVPNATPPNIGISGSTNMTAALRLVNEEMNRNFRPTHQGQARGDYKPLIFLMTDGAPNSKSSAIAAANDIRDRPSGHRVGTFVVLGCGAGASQDGIEAIARAVGPTGHAAFMKNMTADNINEFFKWVTASIVNASKTASQAANASGGEDNAMAPPPIPQESNGDAVFKFTF